MANKKTYTIVINGIQQAVNQVDALIAKINDLDARLKKLQEIKVDVTASASTAVSSASTSTDNDSKSKYDAAKSEAAAQKEITDQIALQNQENLKALQNLTRRKEETKQILRIQKDIVAGVRNENGEYANTLAGRRAMLSDLKRQLANTDLGTDEWTRLRDKIKEVNDQVLEMEKSYGQFGRNVGNYESAFDGLKGFTVTIGGVERQFGSLRDASRQLKQELVNIDTSTEEGKRQMDEYQNAIHQVSIASVQMADAAERAAATNKGLHDTLEVVQGFTALGAISQGVGAVFGFDDEDIARSIQKLQGLMLALQGIQEISKQMESRTGGVGWIKKVSDGLGALGSVIRHPIKAAKELKAEFAALREEGYNIKGGLSEGFVALKQFAKEAGMTVEQLGEDFGMTTAAMRRSNKEIVSRIEELVSQGKTVKEAIDEVGDHFTYTYKKTTKATFEIGKAVKTLGKTVQLTGKAIGKALVVFAVLEAVLWIVEKLGDAFEWVAGVIGNFFTGEKDAIEASQKLTTEMKAQTAALEARTEAIREAQAAGELSNDEAMQKQLEVTSQALKDAVEDWKKFSEASKKYLDVEFPFSPDELLSGLENVTERMKEAEKTMDDEEFSEQCEELAKKVVGSFSSMADMTPAQINRVLNALNSNKFFQSGLNKWLESLPEDMRTAVEDSLKELDKLADGAVDAAAKVAAAGRSFENEITNMLLQSLPEGMKKTEALISQKYLEDLEKADREYGKGTEKYNRYANARTLLYNREIKDARAAANKRNQVSKKSNRDARKAADEALAIQRQLENDKIEAMQDGLEKTLAQLENERKRRLEDAKKQRGEGKMNEEQYQQTILAVNMQFDRKIFESKKQWRDEWMQYLRETGEKEVQMARETAKMDMENMSGRFDIDLTGRMEGLGDKAALEILRAQERMLDNQELFNGLIKDSADLERELYEAYKRLGELQDRYRGANPELLGDEERKEYEQMLELEQKLRTYIGEASKRQKAVFIEGDKPEVLLRVWQDYYEGLLKAQRDYNAKRKTLEEESATIDLNDQKTALEQQQQDELKALEERYRKEIETGAHTAEELEEIEAQKAAQIEGINRNYRDRIDALDEKFRQDMLNRQNKYLNEERENESAYFSGILNEAQRFSSRYANLVSEARDKSTGEWGVINLSSFQKQLDQAKESFEMLSDNLDQQRVRLRAKFAQGLISADQFTTFSQSIEEMQKDIDDNLDQIHSHSKNKIGYLIEDLNTYISAIGSGVQELLGSIFDAQSKELDAMEDALNKENDLLEEKLSKQQEITERHKEAINGIEEELDSARGDRRQHLIDALNAQIQAQRASLAQEKKIQAQKEANQRKLDALDKKRKQEQKKQAIISATISAALATANGLATAPFIPVGVAMGALASALGAAQVAIIANSKYAKGGLLEGPDHAHGGIKVGNTGIEVEGGEYVTNRRSTMHNLNILEYINTKKRKLTLEDFVEFFKGRGTPTGSAKRKNFLATGGQVPALDDNFDAGRLIKQVRSQEDNRPVVVSVVDVVNGMDRVRRVQTMAGIAE